MNINFINAVIFNFSLLFAVGLFGQVITDTLRSIPNEDGEIIHTPSSGAFIVVTTHSEILSGDWWNGFLFEENVSRSYLSFNLLELPPADSIDIIEANVGIYQTASYGNGQSNTYPIWNVAGGDTHFCVLDHVNYGATLDLGDWNAGDPGDPQTLNSNIGILSDTVFLGYQEMDVTTYMQEDVAEGRARSQYRVRFTINTDNDNSHDYLSFWSGNAQADLRPYLIVRYQIIPVGINSPTNAPYDFDLLQNYPNPFNATTQIVYSLNKNGKVRLEVFDNRGSLINTLVNTWQKSGEYRIRFRARELSTGVYFYRLQIGHQSISKKLLLIR